MKDFLKFVIILIFLLMCMASYEEQVERQYTTISVEDDMRYLSTVIKYDNGVDDFAIERAKKEIQRLPTKLWKKYFYNQGVLEITTEIISNEEEKIVGSFSIINEIDMSITVNKDYIEYSLCHEFSHYLYYIEQVKTQRGYAEMLMEKETIWRELMFSNEYFMADNEYFAEVGKLYFKGLLNVEEYPKTVEFFDSITEKYW